MAIDFTSFGEGDANGVEGFVLVAYAKVS